MCNPSGFGTWSLGVSLGYLPISSQRSVHALVSGIFWKVKRRAAFRKHRARADTKWRGPAGSQQACESAWGGSVPLSRYETPWSVFTEEGARPGVIPSSQSDCLRLLRSCSLSHTCQGLWTNTAWYPYLLAQLGITGEASSLGKNCSVDAKVRLCIFLEEQVSLFISWAPPAVLLGDIEVTTTCNASSF